MVANTTKINHNRDSVAEAVAAAGLSSLEPPSSQILVNDDMFLTAPLAPSSSTSFSSAAVVLGSDTTVKSKSDNMMVMDDEEEGEDDEDDEDFGEIVVFRGISSSSSSFSSNSSPHPAAPLQLLQQHQQVDTMRFLGLGDDDNNIHAFDNEEGIANTPIHLLTTRPSLIPGSASLVSAASPAPASSALHPHLSLQHLFYNEDGSDDFGLSAGIGGGGGMGNLWYNVGGINAASPQQSSVQPLPGSHLPPSSTMPSLLHSMLYNPNHNSAVPPPQPPPGF